jgi:hypothetical protein
VLTRYPVSGVHILKMAWAAAIRRAANRGDTVNTNLISAIVAIGLATLNGAAHANSFTNGDFSSNGGNGQFNYNTYAAGWYVSGDSLSSYTFLFANGSADTCCTYGVNNNVFELWGANNGGPDQITAPPGGGAYFIGQDGDFRTVPIKQDISNLRIGKTYTVSFDYAFSQQKPFHGDTLQNWGVGLGDSPVKYTPTETNPSEGFTGWFHDSFSFTADNTAETLSFVAWGNLPVPPFALLADVTFTPDTVPEPSTWAMIGLGFAGLGLAAYRLRQRNDPALTA